MRRLFILIALLFGLSIGMAEEKRPNIILMVAPQARAHEMPSFDQLAATGVRFNFVWASNEPKVSEQMLRSGNYPFRGEERTAPKLERSLREVGYQIVSAERLGETHGQEPFFSFVRLEEAELKATIESVQSIPNTWIMISALTGKPGADEIAQPNVGASVPLIVSGPDILNPGRTTWDLVDFTDFLPTIAQLAGLALADELDGHSFLPSLKDSDDPFEKRNWIFTQNQDGWMICDWENLLHSNGDFGKRTEDLLHFVPIQKTDKIAPHRKERLEMLAKRLRPVP